MRKLGLRKPPLGWNSFDSFDDDLNEKHFYENLEVFIEKLKPAGYECFVIDISWYIIRDGEKIDYAMDEWGRYLPSPTNFPNGFETMIQRTHDAGLKFGLHLMRGVPHKAVDNRMPILGTGGITANMIVNNDPEDHCPWGDMNIGIDLSKPGGQEYYDSVIKQMAEWGVDFIKYDDIEGNPGEMAAVYQAIDKVDYEITLSFSPGGYRYINGQIPLKAYTGANMIRITHDIWDNRADLEDAFEAWIKRSIQEPDRPPWFFFDLDMVPFGRLRKTKDDERDCNLTSAQKRTFITQRALAASPLFMGGHLPETDEYSFSLLTNTRMLACNQNAVIGHPVCRRGPFHVFRTPEKGMGQGKGWIGVFNRTEAEVNGTFDTYMLGLDRLNSSYHIYDIWNEREFTLEKGKGGIQAALAGDDVLFLRYERM